MAKTFKVSIEEIGKGSIKGRIIQEPKDIRKLFGDLFGEGDDEESDFWDDFDEEDEAIVLTKEEEDEIADAIYDAFVRCRIALRRLDELGDCAMPAKLTALHTLIESIGLQAGKNFEEMLEAFTEGSRKEEEILEEMKKKKKGKS